LTLAPENPYPKVRVRVCRGKGTAEIPLTIPTHCNTGWGTGHSKGKMYQNRYKVSFIERKYGTVG